MYAFALLAGLVIAVAGLAGSGVGNTEAVDEDRDGHQRFDVGGNAVALRCSCPPATQAGQMVLYGHIKSLARKSSRFEMRFDTTWWLAGVAAERAGIEARQSRPGPRSRTTTTSRRRGSAGLTGTVRQQQTHR